MLRERREESMAKSRQLRRKFDPAFKREAVQLVA